MDYRNLDFKYSYLYPFLGLILYYLLVIMAIVTLNSYYNILELNIFAILLILLFMFEAVIRFNAGHKLNIPRFIYIIEAALFYLILLFFTEGVYGYKNWGIWAVWLLGIYGWFQVINITAYFNVFRVDCKKIFEKSSGRWSFDEFRRLLDYPSTWKKISRQITLSNIPLMVIWAVSRTYSLFIVTGTILFLFIEISLLALAYLDKKSIDWYIEGIERPVVLKEGWYRFLLLILIVSLTFSLLLPYDYNPLPLQAIGRWINSLLPQINPEKIPINDRPDIQMPAGETGGQGKQEGLNYFHVIFFILQVILFTSFFLLIVVFLFFLLRLEFKNVRNLPDFFKKFISFLINFIKEMFSRVKQLNVKIKYRSHRIKKKRQQKKEAVGESFRIKNIKLPTNLYSMVIVAYNSMLKLFSIRGYGREKDYTPYEYSRELGDRFVNISGEINRLTELYVEIIYSDHTLKKSTTSLVKRLWEKVKKAL